VKDLREKMLTWLFKTDAVRVCPQDSPFWYTSGYIGPYYINTHFLYGAEEKANKLLEIIDNEKDNITSTPVKLLNLVRENYENDQVYRGVIDEMCSFLKSEIDINSVDFFSGGERRDWFFSIIAADILKKPHLMIYKDQKTVILEDGNAKAATKMHGFKALHIADLMTKASSFERAWIPAVKKLGGNIKWSLAVVDRKQGGKELLQKEHIESLSMVDIDLEFFEKAFGLGIINTEQLTMIKDYLQDPFNSMKKFLNTHPEFLKKSLASNDKTSVRAKLCIENNLYKMG
jgi:orotate phosphoribosyltransferase